MRPDLVKSKRFCKQCNGCSRWFTNEAEYKHHKKYIAPKEYTHNVKKVNSNLEPTELRRQRFQRGRSWSGYERR